MVRWLGRVTLMCSAIFVTGCTSIPSGLEPVEGFELDRYLGTWYEIARLDHRFERGLTNVTAEYSLREDGDVNVVNRGYDADANEWEVAEGRAKFQGDPSVASLKVSFFGPFYGGYHVIALDKENYSYAVVSGPSRDFFWILAREPVVDQELLNDLIDDADAWGFPVGELILVDQSMNMEDNANGQT